MMVRVRAERAQRVAAKFQAWLASEWCFRIIVVLLALQACWLALSARYPMAFDENFHFGLIQLHARQWLPFFTNQLPGADQFGAIGRDPSYLYHFLLSLPYRLIAVFTSNQTTQIIMLRLLNTGMAVWGLVLARRLLFRLGGSRALSHATLLLICLVPIVPFLAAQINYDNLFIPLTLLSLLWAFDWLDDLRQRSLSFIRTVSLLSLLGVGCLVKYPFLPIAIAITAVIIWRVFVARLGPGALLTQLRQSIASSNKMLLVVAIVCLAITSALFAERYAVNVLRYHTPNPSCDQVITVQQCQNYSPWARDYFYAHDGLNDHPSKLAYLWQWPFGLWFRSFFAISDTYDTQNPLPLPGGTAIAIAALGLILLVRFARRIFAGNTYRQLVFIALALYLAALFLQTFQTYLKTGEPVAINGRYLLPFLPAIFLLFGLAYRELWRREKSMKSLAAALSILLFILGGGMLAFIIRSQDSWYWPDPVVVSINHNTRQTLKRIVPGSN